MSEPKTTCTDDGATAHILAELEADDKGQPVGCKECGSHNTYTEVKLPGPDKVIRHAYLAGGVATFCGDCGHVERSIWGGPEPGIGEQ